MSLDMQQRDRLLSWTERHLLDRQALEAVASEGQLVPGTREWRQLLDRVLAGTGVLLVALGVVFFFAWNWDELPRFGKFALAASVLSGFAGTAMLSAYRSVLQRTALLGCCVATGALLALIGQTYHTGADIWQLFAVWALLMLPWAWLSGSVACWGLWWGVANLALLRFFSASMWRLLGHGGRGLHRLCALAGLTALLLGGMIGWWQAPFEPLLIGFALAVLLGVPLYRWRRLDLPILALLLFGLIALASAGVFKVLMEHEGFFAFNAIGLFVVVSSALASLWLHRIYRSARE